MGRGKRGNTRRSGRCVYTVFEKQILCSGTMNDYCFIKKRELQPVKIGDLQAQEGFTTLFEMAGNLEAIKATTRFDGISISNETTHFIYISFEQDIYELDINSLFVEIEKSRNRLFKLLKINNFGEQDEHLLLQCKETGFVNFNDSFPLPFPIRFFPAYIKAAEG